MKRETVVIVCLGVLFFLTKRLTMSVPETWAYAIHYSCLLFFIREVMGAKIKWYVIVAAGTVGAFLLGTRDALLPPGSWFDRWSLPVGQVVMGVIFLVMAVKLARSLRNGPEKKEIS